MHVSCIEPVFVTIIDVMGDAALDQPGDEQWSRTYDQRPRKAALHQIKAFEQVRRHCRREKPVASRARLLSPPRRAVEYLRNTHRMYLCR
jgi:hypothetical protein